MEIRIAGYLAASHLLECEPGQWHSVIILGAETKSSGYVETRTPSCVYLRFDDVLDPQPRMIMPTREEIARGLEFAQNRDKILVSCRAGQGRSAALAYLIASQDRVLEEAISLLDPTRHSPNRLVVQIGAAVLVDPGILGRFDAWRREHATIRLSDHLDAIEAEFDELERQGARDRISEPARS